MTWNTFISYDHLESLAIAIGIFLLFLVFRKLFIKYIFKIFLHFSNKGRTKLLPTILLAFEGPFRFLFVVIGLFIATKYYPYINDQAYLYIKLLHTIPIFIVTWGLMNLASRSSLLFSFINNKTNFHIDDILVPFLSRAMQFIILAISFTVILQEFDYQIGGFLTGLGLGGLAFSLAAQDALSNLFGGIVIITEKPFTINDWIQTPSVEGTVEDISFRSTKVRKFDQSLVTVPNATLANEPITNVSKRNKRQLTFSIRLVYNTSSEQQAAVVADVKQLLSKRSDLYPDESTVAISGYLEDGIDLYINAYTKTTIADEFLTIQEEILMNIYEILKENKVEIAVSHRFLTNS